MNGEDFKAWMRRLSLTYASAAAALELTDRSLYRYAKEATLPQWLVLACEGLEARYNAKPNPRDQIRDALEEAGYGPIPIYTMEEPPKG